MVSQIILNMDDDSYYRIMEMYNKAKVEEKENIGEFIVGCLVHCTHCKQYWYQIECMKKIKETPNILKWYD